MEDKKQYIHNLAENITKEQPFINNTELAYQIILHEIINGKLAANEKILQENVAELFGMSRTPVRDALVKLETDGFLTHSENGGYEVSDISLSDFVDFFEFRMIIEEQAAYSAARRITDEQLKKLKDNVAAMKAVQNNSDRYEFQRLDMMFHSTIVEASQNPYLIESMNHYKTKELLFQTRYMEKANPRHIIKVHEAIYKAIDENDEDLARQKMHSHLQFYIYGMC